MNRFQMPAPEALDELIHNQNLNDQQAHELRLVLYNVNEDLEDHRKRLEGRKPRPELVWRLKRFAKVLNDLEYELDRSWKTMTDFLPLDTLEEIGLLMSFTAMEAALKREIRSRHPEPDIESLADDHPDLGIAQIVDQSDFRIAQIEERVEYQRQAIGLKEGPALLRYAIERINQPIKTWFELDRLNRGGRPRKNPARDFLLFRLAEVARAITGRRPTATAGGRFVRLCAPVVAACGLDDRGIERAVEKALKELSARRRPGLRRVPKPPATPTETGSRKS
jgi:hypothetical protein